MLSSDDDGVTKRNFQDLQPIIVQVDVVKQPRDHDQEDDWWRHAESFGGVIGNAFVDPKTDRRIEGDERVKGYSIATTRGQLNTIKNDPLYKNVLVSEDQFKGN